MRTTLSLHRPKLPYILQNSDCGVTQDTVTGNVHDNANYNHLDNCHIMFDKAEAQGEQRSMCTKSMRKLVEVTMKIQTKK